MKLKTGIQQTLISSTVFVLILVVLAAVDHRVRERFQEVVSRPQGTESWTDGAKYVGEAVWSAAQYQSIENAPLVIFATVGVVLVIFMVRT